MDISTCLGLVAGAIVHCALIMMGGDLRKFADLYAAIRANAVHEILAGEGLPSGNTYRVARKSDTDPLFPGNPSMSPNRRVTITLMREEPPLPADFNP